MNDEAISRVFQRDVCAGRVALVTGGGSGIGQEIALKLAQYGAKVAIMGRRQAALQETVDILSRQGLAGSVLPVTGDVRKPEDAQRAVDQVVAAFGKLDVLVNSAAGNFLAAADQLSTNAFRTVLDIDSVGTFNMSRASFAALSQSGDARIVNISAMLHRPATWYQVHASAAKAAVDSVTRTLALEWGEFGIRVTGIAPGPIADTVGTKKLAGDVDAETLNEYYARTVPVGRAGTKCDIAASVLFLVSPAGSFISGDVLVVDGGSYLWRKPAMPRETLAAWSKQMEKKVRTAGPKAKL